MALAHQVSPSFVNVSLFANVRRATISVIESCSPTMCLNVLLAVLAVPSSHHPVSNISNFVYYVCTASRDARPRFQEVAKTSLSPVHPVCVRVSALRLLVDVLIEIGEGNAVSIIPIHAGLTSQKAAGVLKVFRPFLVQLLERGEIPCHKVGTDRRGLYQAVIAYKERIDAERDRALDAVAEQAQALEMGHE